MISRLANLILYAVILAVIGALIYYYTDWFKPATQKAVVAARSVVESIPIGPFSKKEESGEALNQAREAYARGDAEGAVRAYSEVVKKNPTNIDAQGELGNVYYMTGRLQEAAQAFFEAAKLMIDQKQVERAQALLPPIGQGNPALANELQQKLQQIAPQPQQQSQAPEGQPAQVAGGYPAGMMPGQPPMDAGMPGAGDQPPGGPMDMAPQYVQGGQPQTQGAPSY
jgi:tetratricopeptide (TPR) repeat protein